MNAATIAIVVLTLSLALQGVAAVLAVRLIGITGRRLAWALIAAAIVLMAGRRGISLSDYIAGRSLKPLDLYSELVALVISLCMVAGLALIGPLFRELRNLSDNLRTGERRYRLLFENSPAPLWEVDFSGVHRRLNELRRQGVADLAAYLAGHPDVVVECIRDLEILDVNRAALTLHGVGSRGELPDGFLRIWPSQSHAAFTAALMALLEGRREISTEALLQTVDGAPRHVTLRWQVLPGYEQSLARISISQVDLTDQRRMEASLRESESRFRGLVESWPDEIALYDPDCRCVYGNPYLESSLGSDRPLLGVTPQEGYPDSEEMAFYEGKLREVLATGEIQEFEMGWGSPALQSRYRLLRLAPERDDSGRIRGVFAIARDISERKKAEEALRQREAYIRQLVDQSPVAMLMTTGHDDRVILFNRKFTTLFGYTLEDVPDLASWWPLAYPDAAYREEIRARWMMTVEQAIGYGSEMAPVEAVVTCKDGSLREIEVRGSAIAANNVITFVDLTERKRIERALREREQEFRTLAENTPDFIIRWNRDLVRIYVNPAFAAATGISADNLTGSASAEAALAVLQDKIAQVFASGQAVDVVHPWLSENGLRVLHTRLIPEFDHGQTVRVMGCSRDVTELRHAERQLRALVENFPDMISRLDAQGRHLFVNSSLAQYFRMPAERILGKTLEELGITGRPDDLHELLQQAMDLGIPTSEEVRCQLPIGERYLDVRHIPERDETGAVISVLRIARDITERRQAEHQLALLRFALDHVREAAYLIDENARFQYVNSESCRASGYSRGQLMNMGVPDIDPDFPMEIWRDHWMELKKRRSLVFDSCHRRKDGSAIPVEVAANYFEYEGSAYNLALARDISEKKRAEAELLRHREHLQEMVAERTEALEWANRELEAFSYSASHDLRTPLRAIDGFSLMLTKRYDAHLDAEGRRLLRVIRDNTARMAQLIDDILAFSRTGRTELRRSKVDMERLVRLVWSELEPLRADRDIRFEMKTLPEGWADPSMLRQVWTNLLSNAIKFTRANARSYIEVGGAAEGAEHLYYIKDDGAGFDPAYAHKLFGVFQRLHSMDEFEGTGIGLAIVKRVVTRHGGRVMAEGSVGQGATFRFTLPLEGG